VYKTTCCHLYWQDLTDIDRLFLEITLRPRKAGAGLGAAAGGGVTERIWEMRRRSDGSDGSNGRSRCLYALQCEMSGWDQGRRHPRHGTARPIDAFSIKLCIALVHWEVGLWAPWIHWRFFPRRSKLHQQHYMTIAALYPMFAGRSTIVYLHLSSFIHLKIPGFGYTL
jgi:hypothetical protein